MAVSDTRARYERLMELFDAACDLDAGEQRRYLDVLGEHDPALAVELARMLAHDSRAPARLDAAAAGIVSLAGELAAASTGLAPPPPLARRAAPPPPAFLGHEVAERWRVESFLGGGGYGGVYRARARDGSEIAIKFLHHAADPLAERRFHREFLAVTRLDHPGCVRVFDEGVHAGTRYIAMEYVPGGDLTKLIGAPDSVLLPVLRALCETLAYVHARGIVHRDLKPANVLLGNGPPFVPRLADFGIAKVTDEGLSSLSTKGRLVGTIDFVSPEQVLGRAVGPASDLYSLGCMIHVLWTGRPPFEGTTFERLSARVDRPAPTLQPRVPSVPARLAALTDRLLAPAPEDRPAGAREVGEALGALLGA